MCYTSVRTTEETIKHIRSVNVPQVISEYKFVNILLQVFLRVNIAICTFHFSTGVKPYSHVPAVPVGKHEFVDGNGVKIIRFYCEDVPQGAQFQFASPYPNCKEAAYEHWIVREIVDGGLASKYAYFYLPTL